MPSLGAFYSVYKSQDKEWLGCLKSHSPMTSAQSKLHYTRQNTHDTTHHTLHNLMFGEREGGKGYKSGAGRDKQCLPRLICNYFNVLYVTVCDHVRGTTNLSSMKNQVGHWVY